jgi:single-strand DNA-binding protein
MDGAGGGGFPVATSETWRDKSSGEREERTEWLDVVIFNGNLGKIAEQHCKRGTKVYLEGRLQTSKWQDQSGNDSYTTEIVLQRFRGELQLLDEAPKEGGGRNSTGSRRPAFSAARIRSTTTFRFDRSAVGS